MRQYKDYSITAPDTMTILGDVVMIRSNIQPVTCKLMYFDDSGKRNDIEKTEYTCDVVEYTKDEYIRLIADENKDLNEQLLDTQLALTEIYEEMIANANS